MKLRTSDVAVMPIALTNIVWFVVMAFLSWKFPYVSDDYGHMNSALTGERIVSFGQLLPSAWQYYQIWGGRFVSYVMLQWLLMLPKGVFNVLNALVYVVTMNVITQYGITIGKKHGIELNAAGKEIVLAAVFFANWFFAAQFGQTNLWLTGSVTYLWMSCLVLIFGYLIFVSDWIPRKVCGYICMSILCLLAGCSLEVGACVGVVALCFKAVHDWRVDGMPSKKTIWGGIFLIGAAFLMLSPGNQVRSTTVEEMFESTDLIYKYGWRIMRETYYAARYLTAPAALSFLLLFLKSVRNKHKTNDADHKAKIDLVALIREPESKLYVLAFISVYVMTFSSGHSVRVLQFPLFLLLIAIAISLGSLTKSFQLYDVKGIMIPIVTLFLLVMVEIITGTLQAEQYGTHFDRYTTYHYLDESSSLLEGNGS